MTVILHQPRRIFYNLLRVLLLIFDRGPASSAATFCRRRSKVLPVRSSTAAAVLSIADDAQCVAACPILPNSNHVPQNARPVWTAISTLNFVFLKRVVRMFLCNGPRSFDASDDSSASRGAAAIMAFRHTFAPALAALVSSRSASLPGSILSTRSSSLAPSILNRVVAIGQSFFLASGPRIARACWLSFFGRGRIFWR